MEVQSEISKELLREKVGKTIKVLVDEAPDEDGIATARSTADAPDIDGLVFIENNPNVKPGDFVDVKVTDSSDYDLFAEVVKNLSLPGQDIWRSVTEIDVLPRHEWRGFHTTSAAAVA